MVLCEEFLGRSHISFEKRFREQLTDASSSVPRNVAEGFGRFRPKENAQFVRIAKGSANEVLDLFIEAHTKGHSATRSFPKFETAANRAIGTLVGYLRYLENCADRRGRNRPKPTSKPRTLTSKPRNPVTQ